MSLIIILIFFFLNDTAPPEISPLPLHDALPISEGLDDALASSERLHQLGVAVQALDAVREQPRHPAWVLRLGHGHVAQARLEVDAVGVHRSEEHTSELQSRLHLVCRLLLEKKKE